MAITIPYTFDTTGVNRTLLKGGLGLQVIVVLGVLYSLLVSHNLVAALGLVLISFLSGFFATRIWPVLEGSVGSATEREVVVRRGEVFGIRLPGPVGTFNAQDFRALRVEASSGPVTALGGAHERVYLVSREGIPDILVARTDRSDVARGAELARDLGATLGLPFDERAVLY
jgi:hypothetical protein